MLVRAVIQQLFRLLVYVPVLPRNKFQSSLNLSCRKLTFVLVSILQ